MGFKYKRKHLFEDKRRKEVKLCLVRIDMNSLICFLAEKSVLLPNAQYGEVHSFMDCGIKILDLGRALTLGDLENFDIIISSSPLYLNIDQEFYYAARITDLLYKKLHWKRLVYLIVREAANFYYSRLKVCENQAFAKSQMIYLLREARHVGLSLGLDSLRYYSIDIDLETCLII